MNIILVWFKIVNFFKTKRRICKEFPHLKIHMYSMMINNIKKWCKIYALLIILIAKMSFKFSFSWKFYFKSKKCAFLFLKSLVDPFEYILTLLEIKGLHKRIKSLPFVFLTKGIPCATFLLFFPCAYVVHLKI